MENYNENKKSEKFSDKFINFIFSNDARKWIIFIVLLAAILRFIVARNISALGDEMVHGPHAIGFLRAGLISTIVQSPLWFYLTDIAIKFLGVTMFSTRFLSFFYGTLSIIIVYLISSKLFNKKVALISAFLLSISFFTIRYTLMEMDLSALFFLLLALYTFIISIEKNKFPFLSTIFVGIASLIKTLSLFFIPAFLIGFFIFNNQKIQTKKNIKNLIYFGLLVILFFSPVIVHNYLWYKDKKMVDVYFAQYFDIPGTREYYAGLAGYASGILFSRFFEGVLIMAKAIFFLDPLIVAFGVLGLILAFSLKEKRKYWFLLVCFELSGFIFLVLSNWLATHYTTMIPFFSIFGGFFVDKFSKLFKNPKKILTIFLIIIFIFQIYLLWPHLSSRGALSKMRDYAVKNMDKNSIVLADARIYRGRIAWLFHDFNYLESSYFQEFLMLNQNLSGQDVQIKLYFVECARDDCGWGTVTAGPLNDSSESIVNSFSSVPAEKVIFGGGGYDEEKGKPYFKVYQATINLKPQLINSISSTHLWFYYPINYEMKDKIPDKYNVFGLKDIALYNLGWVILIFLIIISLISPIILIYLLIKS